MALVSAVAWWLVASSFFESCLSQCSTSYSCANGTYTGTSQFLGYKSGFGSTIDYTTYYAFGKGSFSMANSPSIKTTLSYNVDCYGVGACKQSTIDRTNTLECPSVGACAYATINATTVSCIGENSCQNSEFLSSVSSITAYGAYSLQNSVINSESDDLTIRFMGFNSGYNSTINCASTKSCTLECFGNGCANVDFDCNVLLSTCNVICNNTQTKYCPTYKASIKNYLISDDTTYSSFYSGEIYLDYSNINSYNLYDIELYNDAICNNDNNNKNAILYDSDQSTSGDIIISNYTSNNETNICCRGHGGCDSSNTLLLNSAKYNIICSGNEACTYITVNGIKILSRNSNLFCNGRLACQYSKLDIFDQDQNLAAYRKTFIGSIFCGGHRGCYYTTITGASSVYCHTYQSCDGATITNVSNVYFLGGPRLLTVSNTDITINNGYGNGNTLNVYFYAYNAAPSSNIYCNNTNDICNIECKFIWACHSVNVHCNGECNICCDNSGTTDIVCPTVTGTGTITYSSSCYTPAPTAIPTELPTSIPSNIPTSNPTYEPTRMPSTEPTNNPTDATMSPSVLPTIVPTSIPTFDPSNRPTTIPSDIPLVAPTSAPSVAPSSAPSSLSAAPSVAPTDMMGDPGSNPPTSIPTNNPTLPTAAPTPLPTGKPSTAPTNVPWAIKPPTIAPTQDDSDASISSNNSSIIDAFSDIFDTSTLFWWILILLTLICGVLGLIDAKCLRYNELYQIGTILLFGVYTLDFFSDISFVVQIYTDELTNDSKFSDTISHVNNINVLLFLLSIFFIVVPLIANIYQLHSEIHNVWMRNNDCNKIVGPWIKEKVKFLYLLSILSGSSFSAIELTNSNLFELKIFDMGLPRRLRWIFKNKRIFSIVLLENLPQLICQITYSVINSNITEITLFATFFSGLSALLTFIEYASKKRLLKSESLIVINFNVIEQVSLSNKKDFVRKTKIRSIVEYELSKDLQIDENQVELLRPMAIRNGVSLTFYVRDESLDVTKMNDLLKASLQSGDFGKQLQKAWKLENAPQIPIDSLKVTKKYSENETKAMDTDVRIGVNVQTQLQRNISTNRINDENYDTDDTNDVNNAYNAFESGALPTNGRMKSTELVASANEGNFHHSGKKNNNNNYNNNNGDNGGNARPAFEGEMRMGSTQLGMGMPKRQSTVYSAEGPQTTADVNLESDDEDDYNNNNNNGNGQNDGRTKDDAGAEEEEDMQYVLDGNNNTKGNDDGDTSGVTPGYMQPVSALEIETIEALKQYQD